MKQKVRQWNSDKEIQEILHEISNESRSPILSRFSKSGAATILGQSFHKGAMLNKRLPYERLDQLTIDILLGVR